MLYFLGCLLHSKPSKAFKHCSTCHLMWFHWFTVPLSKQISESLSCQTLQILMLIWLQFSLSSNSCSAQMWCWFAARLDGGFQRASMFGHGALPSPQPGSSDSHTEHCCQGYHLLILVHNFQPRLQAAAYLMAETESPDTHAEKLLCVWLM